MTTLITRRLLVQSEVFKCYFLRNISLGENNFCSKDSCQTDPPDEQSSEINLNKNEKLSSLEKSLDSSGKSELPGDHIKEAAKKKLFSLLSEVKNEKLSSLEKSLDSSGKSELPGDHIKEAAKKKLFSLLSEVKISPDEPKVKSKLVLSKPSKRPSKKERFGDLINQIKSPDQEMKEAVTSVAKTVGGDHKKTEDELKQKLSSLNLIYEEQNKYKAPDLGIDETLQENLMSSVKDVASTVATPVRSKLTERLLRMSVENKEGEKSKMSIENMVKGMKIQKRSDEMKEVLKEKKKERNIPTRPKIRINIDIFQSDALGIFSLDDDQGEEECKETMWQNLEKKRLKLLSEFAPSNAFEEMIMWTEQGKHWKFPIDNEIEMGEEENVGFHEHVFLDHHLQGFPTRGPIRHFMELVIVGLSKNPYITVERKIENIEWFRQYFKDKEDILRDCGVLEEIQVKAS